LTIIAIVIAFNMTESKWDRAIEREREKEIDRDGLLALLFLWLAFYICMYVCM